MHSLDFHAGRDEMFVRCMSADPEEPEIVGQVESFSTSSFATSRRAIQVNNRTQLATAYGNIVADGTLGDSAYTTVSDLGAVIELDLSSNEVVKEWPIQGMSGAFDIEFSRVNKHLFFEGRVCCTCGFPGADKESCGGYSPGNVTVTVGPSAYVSSQLQLQLECFRVALSTVAHTSRLVALLYSISVIQVSYSKAAADLHAPEVKQMCWVS
jgi:hypothetical protein